MKRISFNYTLQAFLQGKKTVTRREWKDNYASKIRQGDTLLAVNRLYGGSVIGKIKVLKNPYRQLLSELTQQDLIKEGNCWNSIDEFKSLFTIFNPYVVEFEVLEIIK